MERIQISKFYIIREGEGTEFHQTLKNRSCESMKKILCVILSLITLLCGCGAKTNPEEQAPITIARNDWYGAIQRINKLNSDAQSVVSVLENQNYNIVMGNPSDYWSDGYYHFTFNPLASDYIALTIYFNESDDWDTISSNMLNAVASVYGEISDFKVNRVEENHYTATWSGYMNFFLTGENPYLIKSLDCIYDASHNWAQMTEITTLYSNGMQYQEDLFEFAEISATTYALQTSKGRLYCEYSEGGSLKTMYYSELGTDERTFASDIEDAELENMFQDTIENTFIHGNNPYIYNTEEDSMFLNLESVNKDWVLSDSAIDQYVIYENGVLLFRVRNKLTKQFEGFIISDVIYEPVLNEEDGKYYDPVTGEETSLEEFNTKMSAMQEEIDSLNELIEQENTKQEERALTDEEAESIENPVFEESTQESIEEGDK